MEEQKEKPMEVDLEAYYAYLERAYPMLTILPSKQKDKNSSNQAKKQDEGLSK